MLKLVDIIFKTISLSIIKLYQHTLSPDHGFLKYLKPFGCCRFYPTCSEYSYQAIKKYGFFKGSYLGIKRLCKCNPFHPGGYDPVK